MTTDKNLEIVAPCSEFGCGQKELLKLDSVPTLQRDNSEI